MPQISAASLVLALARLPADSTTARHRIFFPRASRDVARHFATLDCFHRLLDCGRVRLLARGTYGIQRTGQ